MVLLCSLRLQSAKAIRTAPVPRTRLAISHRRVRPATLRMVPQAADKEAVRLSMPECNVKGALTVVTARKYADLSS